MAVLDSVVQDIAAEMRLRSDRGQVATYIPELAGVDPHQFGIAVIDAAGNVAAAGDCDVPFFHPEHLQSFHAGSRDR